MPDLLALRAWDADQQQSIDPERVAEAIQRCLELPAQATRSAAEAFRLAPTSPDPVAVRRAARLRFVDAKQAVRQTMELAAILADEGIRLPDAEQLPDTLARLEALERDAFEHWDLFDRQAAEEALAASSRGETLEATDAFAHMAGLSRQEWLAKVAEHKQSRAQ